MPIKSKLKNDTPLDWAIHLRQHITLGQKNYDGEEKTSCYPIALRKHITLGQKGNILTKDINNWFYLTKAYLAFVMQLALK